MSMNVTSNRATAGTGILKEAKNEQGQKIIRDSDYDYIVTKDSFKIVDKNGKEIHVWGDPHVTTSDGDRGQFHRDNLTFELPNGTKVTIEPTAVDANGIAFIKNIAIMNGGKGVEITDVNTNPVIGSVTRNAGELDARYRDGTVLYSTGDIDDLRFSDGREWVGGDASAPFGERPLDGLGGEGRIDVEVEALSFDLPLADLFVKGKGVMYKIPGVDDKGKVDLDNPTSVDVLNDPEAAMRAIVKLAEASPQAAQEASSRMNLILTALTNIMKGADETRKSAVQNLR